MSLCLSLQFYPTQNRKNVSYCIQYVVTSVGKIQEFLPIFKLNGRRMSARKLSKVYESKHNMILPIPDPFIVSYRRPQTVEVKIRTITGMQDDSSRSSTSTTTMKKIQ